MNLTSYYINNNDERKIQFDHNIPQFIVKSHAQNNRKQQNLQFVTNSRF